MIICEFENGNKGMLRHVTATAIILKGSKILMGKRGTFQGKKMLESGKWDTIGGFFDRDETLTECIQREIMEETGWTVKNVKLFRINDNPNRPHEDRQNVEFVFVCEAVKKTAEGDEEVSELKWFDLNDLPPEENIAFDHFESLELYKKIPQRTF